MGYWRFITAREKPKEWVVVYIANDYMAKLYGKPVLQYISEEILFKVLISDDPWFYVNFNSVNKLSNKGCYLHKDMLVWESKDK